MEDNDFVRNSGLSMQQSSMTMHHRPFRGPIGIHNGHEWTTTVVDDDSDDENLLAQPKRTNKNRSENRGTPSDEEKDEEEDGHCEVLRLGEPNNVARARAIPTHEHFKLYGEESDSDSEEKSSERRSKSSTRNYSSDTDGESKSSRRTHRNRK